MDVREEPGRGRGLSSAAVTAVRKRKQAVLPGATSLLGAAGCVEDHSSDEFILLWRVVACGMPYMVTFARGGLVA